MKTIKPWLGSLGAAAAILGTSVSHAAYYDFTTTIHAVGTIDPALWAIDYVLLDNVTTAGNCAVDPNSGKVLIVLPTAKSYAAALAAKLAGSQVQISLDDTFLDSYGNCKMRWMKVLG